MKRLLPQLLLFDGATGAGKSSLLEHIRDEYSRRLYVGKKLTTRRKRVGDNDWEFRFVEYIPSLSTHYSYDSVGSKYAVNRDQLMETIGRGFVYAISCVDRRTMEQLVSEFTTKTIYVYRSWAETDFASLMASRETSDQSEAQLRRDEVASIPKDYQEKLHLYDHVLLNLGSMSGLFEQLSRIMLSYGITQDRKELMAEANL